MLFFSKSRVAVAAVIATLSIGYVGQAAASNYYNKGKRVYSVTVTNIAKGVQFTDILAATHKPSVGFFELGDAPSDAIASLAEGGATGPLKDILDTLPQVADSVSVTASNEGGPPLLFPGKTSTFEITSQRRVRSLSMAAMLLPTNDSFMALDTVALPVWGSVTYYAKGYDAGSETNDELCLSIPGPTCMGDGAFAKVDGEGFVHISSGIHGIGDVDVAMYDWRNPVAKVTIKRIR